MQVEVSKHTEGIREKTTRPNGLPESLIRYDGNPPFFNYSFIYINSDHLFISSNLLGDHDNLNLRPLIRGETFY